MTAQVRVNWKAICLFVLISFAASWPIMIIGDMLALKSKHAVGMLLAGHSLAMLMPAVACVIVSRFMLHEKIVPLNASAGFRPYAYVIAITALLWILPDLLDLTLGQAKFEKVGGVTVLWMLGCLLWYPIPSYGEELGWRGFLLPKLLPMGHRKAVVLHGAIWGAWHWPLLVAMAAMTWHTQSTTLNIATIISGMIGMVIASIVLGIFFGYFYMRYGSLLVVTIFHASYDYIRDMLMLAVSTGKVAGIVIGIEFALIGIIAVILLVRWPGIFEPKPEIAPEFVQVAPAAD